MNVLQLKNLTVKNKKKIILKKINLYAKTGDIIAIIGANGVGKSSLLKAIMKHFSYKITNGSLSYNNKKINNFSTYDMAKLGFYYLDQNPVGIEGIKLIDLYRTIYQNCHQKIEMVDFYKKIMLELKQFNLKPDILNLDNTMLSGGQSKKNELIQLDLIDPHVIMLDEIDSGCDVDFIKIIAKYVNKIKVNKIIFLVSHQQKLFNLIKPNKFILLHNNTIAETGKNEKINKILNLGFEKYLKNNDDH